MIRNQTKGFQDKIYTTQPKPGRNATIEEKRMSANGGGKQDFITSLNLSRTPEQVIRIYNKKGLTKD